MSTMPDFDFGFGKDKFMRGRGWRGLVALALVVTALVVAIASGLSIPRGILGGMLGIWSGV